jgi:hypothetical protein
MIPGIFLRPAGAQEEGGGGVNLKARPRPPLKARAHWQCSNGKCHGACRAPLADRTRRFQFVSSALSAVAAAGQGATAKWPQ